jgi:hypothetical protein
MLNNKKLLQNNTLWRICRGAAIAIAVIYIIDIIAMVLNYYQQYINYTQMNSSFGVSNFFTSASYSILQITVTCLFYATVLFVASAILKEHSTVEEEKIVMTQGADDTADDDESIEVEIIDLPHTRPQSGQPNKTK